MIPTLRYVLSLTAALASVAGLGLPAALAAETEVHGGTATGIPDPSIATSLPGNGDPSGDRARLAGQGFTYGLSYYGEAMANPRGGFSQGAIYDGRAKIVVDFDLEKMIGWTGLSFHANAYQIHGGGLSRDHIGNLLTATSVEALPSTRLFKASFDQKLWGNKLTVRFGQFPADAEFVVSDNAVSQFINTTFGWPGLNQSDLPSAGPAYPLTALGVRVRYEPNDALTLMLATFDGDPAGPGLGDPQRRNNDGLNFRLKDPPFTIGEAQFHTKSEDSLIGLPGTVKLGGWYHAGKFDDLRFASDGRSLADPAASAAARKIRANHALYAVIDQQIYRLPGGDADKGVNLFARITAAPGEQNLIDLYIDGGFKFSGFIPARPDDTVGAGFAYARIGQAARGVDRDARSFGAATPIRDFEGLVEFNYIAQIVPGWTLEPNVQYVIHPGGSIASPTGADPAKAIPDATIIGVRTLLRY